MFCGKLTDYSEPNESAAKWKNYRGTNSSSFRARIGNDGPDNYPLKQMSGRGYFPKYSDDCKIHRNDPARLLQNL